MFRKTDLKSIDFVAASFRRELEEDDFWLNSQDDSEEEQSSAPISLMADKISVKEAPVKIVEKEELTATLMMVKADYNFTAETENELSIKKGDIIKVTKMIDEGWWVGDSKGKKGMFPSNYVTVIENNVMSECEDSSKNNAEIDQKIESNEIDESKFMQTVSKPGFSYLPKGAPITFIGRKGKGSSAQEEQSQENVSTSCAQCDCAEFAANVFKPGHCNNCFHKH